MRILAVCPNVLDSTSYYRAAGPLSDLTHRYGVEITYPGGIGWPDIAGADILFLQRPCTKEAVQAAKMAHRMGLPVWIDWDDDPFHVPVSNAAFETYAKKEIRANILELLAIAGEVTVSTPALAEVMAPTTKNVTVIPNAIDTRFLPMPVTRPDTLNAVLWRGSATHTEDLETVTAQFRDIVQENPETLFGFFGHIPTRIVCSDRTTAFPNVRVRGMTDLFIYFQAVRQFAPKVAVFPLVDDVFNRCKSNISWLETTVAGAVMLAPEIPEFVRPGIVNYRSAPEFRDALSSMLRGEFDLERLWLQSADHIRENLTLATVNQKRFAVASRLIQK